MIGSVLVPPSSASSSTLLVEAAEKTRRRSDSFVCCARSRDVYIPKLEPFSRSKIERGLKEPSLIQKTENDLSDYCTTLEGDKSYSCWKAYFELRELEKESPKDDVEHLIRQTNGVRSLIGLLHGVTAVRETAKKEKNKPKFSSEETNRIRPFPVPDGLPKTQEELEEEEKAKMPDSPFTRLLRSMGKFPAWYTPAPDHETD
ncbi:CCG-binding protein 1 [Aristolochia californica]|uniref:CCG-binding protein 1 n=1 Tax=Aristolochia californica TaxID=171875 RepID=UPI0035D6AE70